MDTMYKLQNPIDLYKSLPHMDHTPMLSGPVDLQCPRKCPVNILYIDQNRPSGSLMDIQIVTVLMLVRMMVLTMVQTMMVLQ